MPYKSNIILLLFIALFGVNSALSQSIAIDHLKEKQALTLNGFLSTNQVLNYQPLDSGNVYKYNSYYTGTLNFNF